MCLKPYIYTGVAAQGLNYNAYFFLTIFRHLELGLLTQFPAPNDEK